MHVIYYEIILIQLQEIVLIF